MAAAAVDLRFMSLALTLGRRGLGNAWPNPAVGAVIVQDSPDGPTIVGRGWTQPGGRPHAEIEALRRAGAAARGATIYTTLEPCSHYGKSPPCMEAIAAAGIKRVISAMDDPNLKVAGQGHRFLRDRGIAVEVGLCGGEAKRVHAGHIRRIREGRPHVMLKIAVSADGKVGAAGRKPVQLTAEPATARVHLHRAMSDAILVGIGTAMADDPQLTCRLPGMSGQSPHRVVLDTTLKLPLDSRLVRTANDVPVWVFAAPEAPAEREAEMRRLGVEVFRIDRHGRHIDLDAVLRLLGSLGITRLMVEAGPITAAAFLAADLVDEVELYRSPKSVGVDGVDALGGASLDAVIAPPSFRLVGEEQVGADLVQLFERGMG